MSWGRSNQASQRPTALGTLLQASTYGMTIPLIVGTTKTAFIWIWAANLRIGGSDKKGKGKGKKKSPPTYVENVDALLGYNPILDVLQIWNNGSRYALDFLSVDIVGLLGGQDFYPSYTIADPNFYSIVGMTFIGRGEGFGPFWLAGSLSGTFNDFGAPGRVPYDMTGQEVPMWNATQPGPDPTNPSGFRFFPFTYRWKPSFGATFYLDADIGTSPTLEGTLRVYYARRSRLIKFLTPLAKARLTFENQLGNGPEWASAGAASSQQVIAPEYAGCGSQDIDLGTAGILPNIHPEVQGSYSVYQRGDADFVDMIETVIRSGVSHTGYALSEIHRGVNCSEFPGPIQKNFYYQGDPAVREVPSHYYVTQGNILLVYARKRGGGGQTILDTLGNNWISLYEGEPNGDGSINVWYAIANASGDTTISLGNYDYDGAIQFFEMGGLDTIDDFQMFPGTVGTLNTTNDSTTPAVVMAFISGSVIVSRPPTIPLHFWTSLISNSKTEYVDSYVRTVRYPGSVTFAYPDSASGLFMIAFKSSDPPSYAKSLGNILDGDSLDLTRAQCRAFGLIGSICMDSQKKAFDWLDDLGKCANAAYVWRGDKLSVIPRSEKSAANNGALYVAPTTPVFHFGPNDFIVDGDKSPVTFDASAQIGNDDVEDSPNILQIEHLDRNSDYNQVVTAEPDAASVALYGPHKASPQVLHMIVDPQVARRILLTQIRRNTQVAPNKLSFKLKAYNIFYEAMDVGLIDEPSIGLLNYPIRLTSVQENDKFELECEAEPFIYGVHAPDLDLAATSPQPNDTFQNVNADPGSVNIPIIFEPVPRLYGATNQAQIWIPVSSSSPAYGGCFVYVSTDGGASYNQIPGAAGTIIGNATTGTVVTDWPAAADPDTTNDLLLDLTQSNGQLQSISPVDENNFLDPCYVQGGSTPSPTVSGSDYFSFTPDPPSPTPCGLGTVPFAGVLELGGALNDQTFAIAHNRNGWGFAAGTGGGMIQMPCFFTPSPPMPCIAANTGHWQMQCCSSGLGFLEQGGTPPTIYDMQVAGIAINGGGQFKYEVFSEASSECSGTIHEETFTAPVSVFSGTWHLVMVYVPPKVSGNLGIVLALLDGSTPGGAPTGWTHVASPPDCGVYWKMATAPDPPGNNYELMTYALADLTSPCNYTLKATGTGNELRRAVYGLPCSTIVGRGIDHPAGSRFALLSPAGTGISKINMDPSWIGKQLFFKFLAFNAFLSNPQSLVDAIAYPYTPAGCPGAAQNPNANNYSVSGGALRQSCSSPTTVTMDQAAVSFPSNSANYNARIFTIPTPTVPTVYFVTILDPAYLGDTGALTNLSAFIETSTAKVGAPGYVYIGAITALPAGCGAQTGQGGQPATIPGLSSAPAKSVPLAPIFSGASRNFSVPHGLGVTPSFAVIVMTSGGKIWFQTPTRYDSTNLFLTASDAGVTGFAVVWTAPQAAEIALAPGAPGNFTVAHGLGSAPQIAMVQMLSGGDIRWQATPWDATDLFLSASDAGVVGKAELLNPTSSIRVTKFARVALTPGAGGNFTVAHGLGVTPTAVAIRMNSDADIWLQAPLSYDGVNLYLVASDGGITGEAEIWA